MTAKRYKEIAARARVPLGFAILVLYVVAAQPSPERLTAGAMIAFTGMILRASAAGCLDKNRDLSISGPYAYTRNPLYVGTAVVGAGFAVAGGVWWLAVLFAAFLGLVYLPVVAEEESHLANLFPAYREYAAKVPRFWPALRPRVTSTGQGFRWALYRQNQEYNALAGYLFVLALLIGKLFSA